MRVFEEPLNGDFLLFYVIINKMKQQITEHEESLFWGEKCQGVGCDLNAPPPPPTAGG